MASVSERRALVSSRKEGSWSHLGRIDERLGLGLRIEGLGLSVGFELLGLVHIPAFGHVTCVCMRFCFITPNFALIGQYGAPIKSKNNYSRWRPLVALPSLEPKFASPYLI